MHITSVSIIIPIYNVGLYVEDCIRSVMRQTYKGAARNTSISGGVLEALMLSVSEAVIRHLRNGDRVRLKDFGLLKLEIESKKVDNLKDFKAKKHIRGVRLHFIPESENGSPALYKDITFEKEIECP